MQLAKPRIDVGLRTNRPEEHLRLWAETLQLPYVTQIQISAKHVQHRFHANGSILKINCFTDPLPTAPSGSGYREVLIARAGLATPLHLQDPDGSLVTLVPHGFEGIHQLGVRLVVRDLTVHRNFFGKTLAIPEEQPGRFRAGETLFILEQGRPVSLAARSSLTR